MTSSTGTVVDPGVDPVDPVVVLAALTSMVQDTEATIIRLQAVREAQLAVAQRLAEHLAAEAGRGESVELASRSVAAELAGCCTCRTGSCRPGWPAPQNSSPGSR